MQVLQIGFGITYTAVKLYDIYIDPEGESGVDVNSFVDRPAHEKHFISFARDTYAMDQEKRIVTGVAIMADTPIYRNDSQFGEHMVRFPAAVIAEIRNKFFAAGFANNTNTNHKTEVTGATMVDSYIVHATDPKFPRVPDALAQQKITDGSWIVSYHITNDQLWADVKSGKFKGFSVEGWFGKKQAKTKTKINMSAKRKTFLTSIFGAFNAYENMSEATTVDGVTVYYEGDLAVGSTLEVEVDGERVPAPEGAHQVEVDGVTYALEVDASGVLTSFEEVTAMSEESEVIAEALRKVVKTQATQFAALTAEIKTLREQLSAVQKGEKFSANPAGAGAPAGKSGFNRFLKK